MKSTSRDLLVRPTGGADGVITRVTSDSAGWEFLNMEVRHLGPGEQWEGSTLDCEQVFVSDYLVTAFSLNLVYLTICSALFLYFFEKARQSGQFLQAGE